MLRFAGMAAWPRVSAQPTEESTMEHRHHACTTIAQERQTIRGRWIWPACLRLLHGPALVVGSLVAVSVGARADAPVVTDTVTAYKINTFVLPCFSACDLSPAYNHYAAAVPFRITKITFDWDIFGCNNCDGYGHYGAVVSRTSEPTGDLAASTNTVLLSCVGCGPPQHGTAELVFAGEPVPASFFLDFRPFDIGVQQGADITVTNVTVWAEDGISGHVLFEDGKTPVPNVHVDLYAHPLHALVASVPVGVDGSYAFGQQAIVPGMAYDLLAVAGIPDEMTCTSLAVTAVEPFDLSPAADFTVDAAGIPSNGVLDFTFRWPVVMLSGLSPSMIDALAACFAPDEPEPVSTCGSGQQQFASLQPYLASNVQTALLRPRQAVIPLMPDMTTGSGKSLLENYATLISSGQLDDLMTVLYPGCRFQLLGYSQGGLVARLVLDNPAYGPRIAKVVQVATPNCGSCLANAYLGHFDWLLPLTTESMAYFNTEHPSGHGVPFYVLAGSQFHECWALFHKTCCLHSGCLASTPACVGGALPSGSDSVVPIESVTGLGALDYDVKPAGTLFEDHLSIVTSARAMAFILAYLEQPSG
jgi:hypothetical protein